MQTVGLPHCHSRNHIIKEPLCFLWHKDNDINKDVIEYRMKVHVLVIAQLLLWQYMDCKEPLEKVHRSMVLIQSNL